MTKFIRKFMPKKKATALPLKLGFAVFCLAIYQAPAQAGGVVGNGNAGSCSDAALKGALSGGGTVTFNCGSSPATLRLGSEKLISANTVIDGGGKITLSGNYAVRLLNVANGKNLTIKNLTLANGNTAGQGAAILASYQNLVTVNNCKFTGNLARQPGEAGGGAIYSSNGTLAVSGSTFTDNKASIGGGIRILNSNLSVISSSFARNKAVDSWLGNGGAIYVDGANGDGGQIVIRTSSFTNNSATAYGGALFNSLYNNNKTAITGSSFTGNYVGGGSNGQGGAIWSNGDPVRSGHWALNKNTSTITIVNSTLSGNIAKEQGGAIFLARHPEGAVISQSTISGNKALNSNGAGILQTDGGKVSLLNSTITGNTTSGTYAMGAGVYVAKNGKAYITNSTIADNIANWQAGGVFGSANVTLKNTILANNVALNGGNNWNIKHNCFQAMTNGGNNLQYPKPKDGLCTSGTLVGDPKLDVLKNNGGATPTRALLSGSLARDNASGCPVEDQCGKVRAEPANPSCDIGAYEAI